VGCRYIARDPAATSVQQVELIEDAVRNFSPASVDGHLRKYWKLLAPPIQALFVRVPLELRFEEGGSSAISCVPHGENFCISCKDAEAVMPFTEALAKILINEGKSEAVFSWQPPKVAHLMEGCDLYLNAMQFPSLLDDGHSCAEGVYGELAIASVWKVLRYVEHLGVLLP
jgi:hypothetical protein